MKSRAAVGAGSLLLLAGTLLTVNELGHAGTTERVSVSSTGEQANAACKIPCISADGRFVAFHTWATNLVPRFEKFQPPVRAIAEDVYVFDRRTRRVELVSVGSNSIYGNRLSASPSISADGRLVAFASRATKLIPDDWNNHEDVFVFDRRTRRIECASINSIGKPGNDTSFDAKISANGRFVAFTSLATTLVSGDTNGKPDIFAFDRHTRQTERVSISSQGQQPNENCWNPSISGDGRFVAFCSDATSLVPRDTNNSADVFVFDRQTERIERVSVSSEKQQGNKPSDYADISGDGRFIAFQSEASNLVPGDTNGKTDIFVFDRRTRKIERVSVSTNGEQANGVCDFPRISADGRFVAFHSDARNLVPADTNGKHDIFVFDRQTRRVERVSVNSKGEEANGRSHIKPAISADGRFVAFWSEATNLVPGDTNGNADVFVRQR